MASDKEMEGYARDCVRLAQLADDPELRQRLFQMAREWMGRRGMGRRGGGGGRGMGPGGGGGGGRGMGPGGGMTW